MNISEIEKIAAKEILLWVYERTFQKNALPFKGEGEELQIAAQIRGGFGNLQMKLAVTGNIKHRTGFIHLPVGRVRQ